MDKRIILFAVIVILIGGGLFALRFFSGRGPKNLDAPNFSVSSRTIQVEDSVAFEDNTAGARMWNWDFGDPGGLPDIRRKGNYRFVTAGRYTLRLTINGQKTDSSITIVVNPRNGPAYGARVIIAGPSQAYVGDEVVFRDITPNAQHTNWQNTDMGDFKRDSKTYKTIFTHRGDFQIIAENDLNKGTDGQGIRKVHVMEHPPRRVAEPAPDDKGTAGGGSGGGDKPKPPAPQPAPPERKSYSDGDLTNYFRDLGAKEDAFRADYPLIKKATGGDESIPVTFVRKSDGGVILTKPGLFGACRHLNMMQMQVTKVTSERDPSDNTLIKAITVTVNQ